MQQQTFIDEFRLNFFLRYPRKTLPSLVYAVISLKAKKIRLSTGVKVYPAQWNMTHQRAIVSTHLSRLDNSNNTIANDKIEEINRNFCFLKEFISENPCEIANINSIVKTIIYTGEIMKNPIEYLTECVKQDKTIKGEIVKNGKIQYTSTKKDYLNTINWLNKYFKIKPIKSFNDINLLYIKGFLEFLRDFTDADTQDGKLTRNYCRKKFTQVGTILETYCVCNNKMKATVLKEWKGEERQKNPIFGRVFPRAGQFDNAISLRDEELLLLWEHWHKLTSQTDKDILATFLLECMTGQRFSDAYKVKDSLENIHEFTTIQLKQNKGEKILSMQVLFELTKTILAEYKNNNIKGYSNSYSNNRMKQIAKDAGLVGNKLVGRQSGGAKEVATEMKPRFSLIGQHTGRRTFITMLALRGWEAQKISIYSGHIDIDTVYKYMKIRETEEYNQFKKQVKNNPSSILRFCDDDENEKVFGVKSEDRKIKLMQDLNIMLVNPDEFLYISDEQKLVELRYKYMLQINQYTDLSRELRELFDVIFNAKLDLATRKHSIDWLKGWLKEQGANNLKPKAPLEIGEMTIKHED